MPLRTLVVEHKTTSSDISPGSRYWRRLTLDTQVSQYLRGTQYRAEGMLYDVIRKPRIEPLRATPEESRRYTKPTKTNPEPRLYASQREHDETPAEYLERLLADIAEAPDAYYQRGVIVRTQHEAEEAARDTWLIAGAIRDSLRLQAWPRNPGACESYGQMCPYWRVCAEGASISDPTLYRTAETPHEELPEQRHRLPLLSNSAMSTYRACPRRYLYAYVMLRRPHATAAALTFGTLMHAALEVWWRTVDLDAALAVLSSEEDPFTRASAEALMRGYHARWRSEPITVLGVEVPFVAPLRNPETGALSKSFELAGKCDAIVEMESDA